MHCLLLARPERGPLLAVWWSDLHSNATGAHHTCQQASPQTRDSPAAPAWRRRPTARPGAGNRGLLRPPDVLRGDLVDHPHLARPPVWVAILSEILLGEAVDVRVPAVLGDLRHTPPDADVPIRIPRVDDRQRHGRVPAHVPVFYPPPG